VWRGHNRKGTVLTPLSVFSPPAAGSPSQGVSDQSRLTLEPQLSHQVFPVRLNCPRADSKAGGDLADAGALGG